MNWIKRITYNDGGRLAAGFVHNQTGGCVVRALSIVTGKGYVWAQDVLNLYIGRERSLPRSDIDDGVYQQTFQRVLKANGAGRFIRIKRWNQLPTSGRLFVVTEHHALAYIDGVIHDTFDPVDGQDAGQMIGYYVLT